MAARSARAAAGRHEADRPARRRRPARSRPGTLDTLGGVVAIAIERAQFLEERKAGELTRQSEELKTALLASLGHDLRTPLTAIRVAATNIQASSLTRRRAAGAERPDSRGGRAPDPAVPEHPRDGAHRCRRHRRRIALDASLGDRRGGARPGRAHAAAAHRLDVKVDPDVPVRLDPRLTATALAHLLENAAQYTPSGSTIDVQATMTDDGLVIEVRDHGPGIAPADLPHLFERFYRGDAARARASGTGMGLWIARGLLAVERGPDLGGELLRTAARSSPSPSPRPKERRPSAR